MKEQRFERGRLPWEPFKGGVLVKTLDEYDMPLLGVFGGSDGLWLFSCEAGQVNAWSVWRYVPVSENEAGLLAHLLDDELGDFVNAILNDRSYIVAVSHEGDGLVEIGYETISPDSSPSPLDAAAKLYPEMAPVLKSLSPEKTSA